MRALNKTAIATIELNLGINAILLRLLENFIYTIKLQSKLISFV
jgi:hypothetical protein